MSAFLPSPTQKHLPPPQEPPPLQPSGIPPIPKPSSGARAEELDDTRPQGDAQILDLGRGDHVREPWGGQLDSHRDAAADCP